MAIKKIRLKDGEIKWEVRVYENGRGSKRLSEKFDRKIDAENWVMGFEKRKAEQVSNPFAQITFQGRYFKEEADYWLEDGKNRFSAGHLKKVIGIISEILRSEGNFSIEKAVPALITKFQHKQLALGLTNTTVNRKTEVIMAILNYSVKQRRIPMNPAIGFKKLRKTNTEMSFWSEREALSFLNHALTKYPRGYKLHWVYVAYLVAINTGLRAGEIWGLRPSDINRSKSTMTIRRQFNRVLNEMSEPKSKRFRVVPCNSSMMSSFDFLISSMDIKDGETIFQNDERKPVCHDNFAKRQFENDLKSWGGRPIRFHDLRHTAATLLVGRNIDLKTVKEICGHADIATTMNYAHLIDGAIEGVAKSFEIAPDDVNNNSLARVIGLRSSGGRR